MFLNTVKKFGPIKATVIFTIIIVSFCVTVTFLAVSYFDPPIQSYQLMMAVLFPVSVFFFPAIYFFKILLKLNSAEVELKQKYSELENVLKEVKILEGLFPICTSCKSIRDDEGEWNQIERYIETKSDAKFSHSVCPDCFKKLYPGMNMNGRTK